MVACNVVGIKEDGMTSPVAAPVVPFMNTGSESFGGSETISLELSTLEFMLDTGSFIRVMGKFRNGYLAIFHPP
jgi:hypothetical protein